MFLDCFRIQVTQVLPRAADTDLLTLATNILIFNIQYHSFIILSKLSPDTETFLTT